MPPSAWGPGHTPAGGGSGGDTPDRGRAAQFGLAVLGLFVCTPLVATALWILGVLLWDEPTATALAVGILQFSVTICLFGFAFVLIEGGLPSAGFRAVRTWRAEARLWSPVFLVFEVMMVVMALSGTVLFVGFADIFRSDSPYGVVEVTLGVEQTALFNWGTGVALLYLALAVWLLTWIGEGIVAGRRSGSAR